MSTAGDYLEEHQEAVASKTIEPATGHFGNLDGRPLIDAGLYRFAFVSQGGVFYSAHGPRISIQLRVTSGAFAGVVLPRFYNVRRSKSGEVQIPAGQSAFLRRESVGILGHLTTDLSGMADLPLVGRVRNTFADGSGDPIPHGLRYSTVSKLFLATPEILESLGDQT